MRRYSSVQERGSVLYCPNCGKKQAEAAHFCSGCGMDLSAAASPKHLVPASGSSPTGQTEPARRRVGMRQILIAVAVILAISCVALAVVIVRGRVITSSQIDEAAASETTASVPESESQINSEEEQARNQEDAIAEGQQSAEKHDDAQESGMAKVADAYAVVLDNADSYFAEIWFEQYPDSQITYTLAEASGDDVPELFLAAHYSNVGSHASGGTRFIPFTYDEGSGAAVEATNDEYALFADPWGGIDRAASGHSLVTELRYFRGMDSAYFRYVVNGTSLAREEIAAGEYDRGEPLNAELPCSDRSLIDTLR